MSLTDGIVAGLWQLIAQRRGIVRRCRKQCAGRPCGCRSKLLRIDGKVTELFRLRACHNAGLVGSFVEVR